MITFVDLFLGTAEFKVGKDGADGLFSLGASNIQLSSVRAEEGYLFFKVPLYAVKKVKGILGDNEYEIVKISGLPRILMKYRKRWGLAVGALIALLILTLSTKVIWTFNISGNENVPDEVIIDTLNELGCTYGTRISKIDFDILCNDFLIRCPDIAWISVNMDGTHANVEVRETMRGKKESGDLNNIIASRDGQIIQITAYGGRKQVAIGDVVRAGDLLISAVGSYGEGYNKIESADGLVLAETTVEFTVEIPYISEDKASTGNEIRTNTLKIFDFYINLFVNSGIPYKKYDRIINNSQVKLFGVVDLPVWVQSETINEYYSAEKVLSENEAKMLALSEYASELRKLSAYSEILDLSTRHETSEDAYRIYASVHCICDIASAAPITVK